MTSDGRFIAGLFFGLAGALVFGVGGFIAVVLVLGVAPLAFGPDGTAFVSGLLAGFGATWLALMAMEAATGGALSDPLPWVGLGVVALGIGVAAGAARLRGGRPRRPSPR
ncbi:MAG TPA: hypothetical protein VEY67_06590 [Candidatus Dormibacteraeota bacterium]|nr:hypothetical protein [Candidatus Dormibacteraeota bacterium]